MPLGTAQRIGLWFGCFVLAVAFFSLLFGLVAATLVFRMTMIFALPVSFLYLPFVIWLKDARQGRGKYLLMAGILIGPVFLAGWGLILQLRGGDPHMVWVGDGEDQGMLPLSVYALVVGSLTSGCYVGALTALHRRHS